MKRFLTLIALAVLFAGCVQQAPQAKYVFIL